MGRDQGFHDAGGGAVNRALAHRSVSLARSSLRAHAALFLLRRCDLPAGIVSRSGRAFCSFFLSHGAHRFGRDAGRCDLNRACAGAAKRGRGPRAVFASACPETGSHFPGLSRALVREVSSTILNCQHGVPLVAMQGRRGATLAMVADCLIARVGPNFVLSRGAHRFGRDAGRCDLNCACDGAAKRGRGPRFARPEHLAPRDPEVKQGRAEFGRAGEGCFHEGECAPHIAICQPVAFAGSTQ